MELQRFPLLYHSESLKGKLHKLLGDKYDIELAMRYQHPSMDAVLERMRKKNYNKILILPLFPQYASATSGSAVDKAMKIIKKWWVIPEVKMITQFWDDEGYLNSFAERGKQYNLNEYDHILFSYHGLPVRQVDKVHFDGKPCSDHNCENDINEGNKYCYKAQSYATTRVLAARLNIPPERYTVCFQSRLDKNWLTPFTDKTIIDLANKGAKKLLVFSPAFVADCLETVIEVADEYHHLFKQHGGEKVQLVESLNDNDRWVKAVMELIITKIQD